MSLTYLIRRLFYGLLVFVGVATFVFFMSRLGGDPAVLLVEPGSSLEDIANVRRSLGLDEPLLSQFVSYWTHLLQGDPGDSFRYHLPALQLFLERMPATLALAGTTFGLAVLLGFPLGMIAALKQGTVFDRLTLGVALAGVCAPTFFTGIVLILIVGVWLRWLPVMGIGGLEHLLMPAFTLASFHAAVIARLFRSSLLEEFGKDYVRTAHAKGLRAGAVTMQHVTKNAAIPVVTVLGMDLAHMLGGSAIVETVFAYPGMGFLAVTSIQNRDFPVVQAYVILVTLFVVVANLLVDMIYVKLDPRIRYT